MAMLGREVRFPCTLIVEPPEDDTSLTVPFVTDLRTTLRQAHKKVREHTGNQARSQSACYDFKRVKLHNYAAGMKVWLFWPQPKVVSRQKKLTRYWTGPWTIKRFLNELNVEITRDGTKQIQKVHVNRLLPCGITPTPKVEIQTSEVETETSEMETESCEVENPIVPAEEDFTDYDPAPLRTSSRSRKLPKHLENYILD